MKTISSLRDLEPFGIIPLTGETDNLCFRILCDLTQRGADIVSETYGLISNAFHKEWNNGVGSVMLPYDAWKDVGIIALLSGNVHTVLKLENGTLVGLSEKEEYHPSGNGLGQLSRGDESYDWPSCYGKVIRQFKSSSQPHEGTRNAHAMSGRTI